MKKSSVWTKRKVVSASKKFTTASKRVLRRLINIPAKYREERRINQSLPYLKSLKNKHLGKRGFVIGNGPSLKLHDLEKLENEITIASNKIYLAFPQVKWRPNYYTIVDNLVWEKANREVGKLGLTPIVTSYLPQKPIPHHVVRYLGNSAIDWHSGKRDSFSPDLCRGYYGGYSVTFENLQLAWHLGLNPIILLGCDHYYKGETEKCRSSREVETEVTNNHFLPNYRAKGEIVNRAPIEGMTTAYEVAAWYAAQHGRDIVNATRGGHLEVFQRQSIDDLFQ